MQPNEPDLRISLEHMTVLGMSTEQIIATGEELRVDHVSLILDTGPYDLGVKSFLANPEMTAETARRLESSPLSVHVTEGFLLEPETNFDRLARLLDVTAALGTGMAVVMVIDPDQVRAAASLAKLCEMARPLGIIMSVEFVATTPVAGLGEARQLVLQSQAQNAAISCDILHLVRSGGAPADIQAFEFPFGAAQLCDGPAVLARDQWDMEGIAGRLVPGEGDFPVVQFLAALPPEVVVGVEVPMGIEPGPDLISAAARSVAAARRLSPRLAKIDPGATAMPVQSHTTNPD